MSDSFLPAVTAGDGIAVERTVYGYRVHLDQESIPAAAASEPYTGYFKVIAAEEGGSVRIVDGSVGNTGAPAGYVYIDRFYLQEEVVESGAPAIGLRRFRVPVPAGTLAVDGSGIATLALTLVADGGPYDDPCWGKVSISTAYRFTTEVPKPETGEFIVVLAKVRREPDGTLAVFQQQHGVPEGAIQLKGIELESDSGSGSGSESSGSSESGGESESGGNSESGGGEGPGGGSESEGGDFSESGSDGDGSGAESESSGEGGGESSGEGGEESSGGGSESGGEGSGGEPPDPPDPPGPPDESSSGGEGSGGDGSGGGGSSSDEVIPGQYYLVCHRRFVATWGCLADGAGLYPEILTLQAPFSFTLGCTDVPHFNPDTGEPNMPTANLYSLIAGPFEEKLGADNYLYANLESINRSCLGE